MSFYYMFILALILQRLTVLKISAGCLIQKCAFVCSMLVDHNGEGRGYQASVITFIEVDALSSATAQLLFKALK